MRIAGSRRVERADPTTALAEQIKHGRLLALTSDYRDEAAQQLAALLGPHAPPELQRHILETLRQRAVERVPDWLADRWPQLSTELQQLALDIWLARTNWTLSLLDQLEQDRVPIAAIDLVRRAALLQHPHAEVQVRARQILEQQQRPRAEIIERYAASLNWAGDATRGLAIYRRHCASCHRRGGEGHDVGPDLATVVDHAPAKLLANILDPSGDIQPGYLAYTCVLESGEVLSGILAGETAGSLTLKLADGNVRHIARREIELLKSTGQSFMPEGLEQQITPEEWPI